MLNRMYILRSKGSKPQVSCIQATNSNIKDDLTDFRIQTAKIFLCSLLVPKRDHKYYLR